MKLNINKIYGLLFAGFVGCILFFFLRNALALRQFHSDNTILRETLKAANDSLGKLNAEKYYLQNLLTVNSKNEVSKITYDLEVFEMNDREKKDPIKLNSILKSGKPKLVIRYTEIGCNACADSTLKLIRRRTDFREKYDAVILVDFTNYEYYLKWRKLSDVSEKIYWLKKGELPYKIEKKNVSYMFVVDPELKASTFFIPNSMFTQYLYSYFDNLNNL